MQEVTTQDQTQSQQYSTDKMFVCFEQYSLAPKRWYSPLYRLVVSWLQFAPMEYSHVFLVLYSAANDTWYMAESK